MYYVQNLALFIRCLCSLITVIKALTIILNDASITALLHARYVRKNLSFHIHFSLRNSISNPVTITNMTAKTTKYPDFEFSSGMLTKFIP